MACSISGELQAELLTNLANKLQTVKLLQQRCTDTHNSELLTRLESFIQTMQSTISAPLQLPERRLSGLIDIIVEELDVLIGSIQPTSSRSL